MASTQSSGGPLNFIVGLLVIVAIVAFIVWLAKRSGKKTRESAWSGKVVKKHVVNDYGEGVGEVNVVAYKIKFQLDDGKHKDVSVPQSLYDSVAEGDKVVKTAGESYPKKA